MRHLVQTTALAALVAVAGLAQAQAETVIKVGAAAGGGYDTAGRLMARFLPAHLGETGEAVVENVPGAGSVNLAKQMSAEAADNELGMIQASVILNATVTPEDIGLDFSKFKWIGSVNSAESICLAGKDSGIASVDDFLTKEFKVGATTAIGGIYRLEAVIKNTLGAKYEIITGFEGIREIEAAIDRGEIQAYCGGQLDAYLRDRASGSRVLLGSLVHDLTVDGVTLPSFASRATKPEDRAAMELYGSIGKAYYPVLMGPNVPDETVARYRKAFEEMLADPAFVAEAGKTYSSFTPLNAADTEAAILAIGSTDPAVVARLAELQK